MALAVVVSLFASYFVAMTVVPLFCARFLKARRNDDSSCRAARFQRSVRFGVSTHAQRLRKPGRPVASRIRHVLRMVFFVAFGLSLLLYTADLDFLISRRPTPASLSSLSKHLPEPS